MSWFDVASVEVPLILSFAGVWLMLRLVKRTLYYATSPVSSVAASADAYVPSWRQLSLHNEKVATDEDYASGYYWAFCPECFDSHVTTTGNRVGICDPCSLLCTTTMTGAEITATYERGVRDGYAAATNAALAAIDAWTAS